MIKFVNSQKKVIFIGADHRGFKLKNQIKNWLLQQKYKVMDCGNSVYDKNDDYPDFAQKVAKKIIKLLITNYLITNPLGIVICGSGVGVSIAVNRFKNIYCALGFDISQVKHARENDHINVLALPSDFLDLETAKKIITAFLTAKPIQQEKYLRRLKKLDNI